MLLSFGDDSIFVGKTSDDERIYSINVLYSDIVDPFVVVMTYSDMVNENFCDKYFDVDVSELNIGDIARDETFGMVIIRLK